MIYTVLHPKLGLQNDFKISSMGWSLEDWIPNCVGVGLAPGMLSIWLIETDPHNHLAQFASRKDNTQTLILHLLTADPRVGVSEWHHNWKAKMLHLFCCKIMLLSPANCTQKAINQLSLFVGHISATRQFNELCIIKTPKIQSHKTHS